MKITREGPLVATSVAVVLLAAVAGTARAAAGLTMAVYHNDGGLTTGNDTQWINAAAYATSHTPDYTFTNTADTFQYSTTTNTSAYLGTDAAGAALTDTASIDYTLFDANGYLQLTTPGDYTFNVVSSDDAAEVLLNHNGIAANAWTGTYSLPASATVNLPVGSYPIEVLHWQDWGGASLNLQITGPGTVTYATVIPEPASLGLLAAGTLLVLPRRRRA